MGALQEEAAELTTKAFTSIGHSLEESKAGESVANLIRQKWIPTHAKATEALTNIELQKPPALQRPPHEIASEARNVANQVTWGPQHSLLAAHVAAVGQHPSERGLWNGGQIAIRQQRLADNVAMFLHDTSEKSPALGAYSVSKRNIRQNSEYDLQHIKIGAHDLAPIYSSPGAVERRLTGYANTVIAPAIAIPHIGTILNYAFTSPISALVKTTAQLMTGQAQTKQLLQDTGALAQTAFDSYSTRWYGARGIIGKNIDPKLGSILAQITHHPGFNWVRESQIAFGAALGKNTLEQMSQKLVNSGGTDRRAIYELKRMGLDPAKVFMNKGALSHEDYKSAIFHFVDSKIFLNNSLDRAYYSRANALTRTALMFHGYVVSQARFLKREIYNKVRETGDLTLIPQLFATLGVAAPIAGTLIGSLEMFARGSGQEATPGDDLRKLRGDEGHEAQLLQYLDGLSHLGAFGVGTSWIQSASRRELANDMVGALGNVFLRPLEDTVIPINAALHDKSANFKPLERDLLEDSLSDNLGKILVHKYLPTQTESRSRNSKFKPHMKSMSGLKKLKSTE